MEGCGEGVGMERGSHSLRLEVKDQRVSAMEEGAGRSKMARNLGGRVLVPCLLVFYRRST